MGFATTDRYGRVVGEVWVNGMDANLEEISQGMAWVYRKYGHEPAYFAAEKAACQARVGLWSQPNGMPPWEYRHNMTTEPGL